MSATYNPATGTQSEGELDWIVRTAHATAASGAVWRDLNWSAVRPEESTQPSTAFSCLPAHLINVFIRG
jgi:hypothetical protein